MERSKNTGKMLCEDGGPGWSDVSISQGMPKITVYQYKLREGHKEILPLCSQEEKNKPLTIFLISDFSLQNCKRIHFCSFEPPSLYNFVMGALDNEYSQEKSHRVGDMSA